MDPVYAVVFEVLMLVCFGLSWPFNIAKSWKSKTAKGKSLIFELCIAAGYCFGIAGKFLSGNVTYVLIVYVLDLVMVCIDIILTLRNMALDAMAEKKAAKAAKEAREALEAFEAKNAKQAKQTQEAEEAETKEMVQ